MTYLLANPPYIHPYYKVYLATSALTAMPTVTKLPPPCNGAITGAFVKVLPSKADSTVAAASKRAAIHLRKDGEKER